MPNMLMIPKENVSPITSYVHSLEVGTRQGLHHRSTIHKPSAEDAVGIREHPILQTDDDELTPFEPILDQSSDVLSMGEIERRIYFVKNVHRSGLELEKGHDERDGNQGAAAPLVVEVVEPPAIYRI